MSTNQIYPSFQQQSRPKWVRTQQPLILYLMVMAIHIYTAIQIGILLLYAIQLTKSLEIILAPTLAVNCFRIIVILVNSWWMGGIKGIIRSYTMLDLLGVLSGCNAAMIVAFLLSFTVPMSMSKQNFFIGLYITSFLVYFCLTGNFRLMMKTCKWQRKKVIGYKLCLYVSAFYYVSYGIYYTINPIDTSQYCHTCVPGSPSCGISCTSTQVCCLDIENALMSTFQSLNDFIIIITGTGLAYSGELIAFMSDYDGVNQMETHYTVGLIDQQQNKSQIELSKHNIPNDSLRKRKLQINDLQIQSM